MVKRSKPSVGITLTVLCIIVVILYFSLSSPGVPARKHHSKTATDPTDHVTTTEVHPTSATKPVSGNWKARFHVQLSASEEGTFVLEVTPNLAPLGAQRFRDLVEAKYYDDCRFFRVIQGFVAQFGLSGTPGGGQRWGNIKDDPVKGSNVRGTITFAMAGPATRTTQLFLNFADNINLDGMGFAPFGKVVEGMDTVDKINKEYREQPNQGQIQARGNEYLNQQFPRLSYIKQIEML